MDPRKTAVLAIHWQRDIVKHEGAFGEFYGEMVERTGVIERSVSLLASARARNVPIFYTRVCYSEGHPELDANCPLLDLVGQRKALVDGSPGAMIIPELSPQPGDVVVSHTRVAGTQGTNLVEQLRARDIKHAAILGVSTNISVESTARNLADAGFDVHVVADCCTTSTQEGHDASIGTLGLLTRTIMNAGEFIVDFARGGQA